jgi:hypothetical protein
MKDKSDRDTVAWLKIQHGKKGVTIILLVIFVASSNCVCCTSLESLLQTQTDRTIPDQKWHNYTFVPSSEVTIGILINTTGPAPVTILDSGSSAINIALRAVARPQLYLQTDNEETQIYLRLDRLYDYSGAKAETFVYLPHGPIYNITIVTMTSNKNDSKVVNSYSGGNLNLRVNNMALGLPSTPEKT